MALKLLLLHFQLYCVTTVKNHTSIQFKFDVQCYYGGEVFLDNVSIVDTTTIANVVAGITNMDLVVYPNPFSDYIIIKTSTPIMRWSISNSLGQEVIYKEGIQKTSIQISTGNLPRGVYYLKSESKSATTISSIVK
jgi:hypothetical protein